MDRPVLLSTAELLDDHGSSSTRIDPPSHHQTDTEEEDVDQPQLYHHPTTDDQSRGDRNISAQRPKDKWAVDLPHLLVSTNVTLEKFHVFKWQEIARLAKLIAARCFRRVRLAGDDRALYECFYRSFPHELVSKARFVGVTRAAFGVDADIGVKSTLPPEQLALGRHLVKMQYVFELSADNVLMVNWRLLLLGLHFFQYPMQSIREHLSWGFQIFHSTGFLDSLSDATIAKIGDVAAMLTLLTRNQASTRLVAERFRQAQVLEHTGELTPATVRQKLVSSRLTHRRFLSLLALPPLQPLFARASEYTTVLEDLATPIYREFVFKRRKHEGDRKKIARLRYYHRTKRLRACFHCWHTNARVLKRTRRLMVAAFHRLARERRRHAFALLKRHAIESWAATEIQRLVRGMLGRRVAEHEWKRVQAAIRVQGAYRMRSHFVQFMKELRRRHRAAIRIQRVYWGRVGRVRAKQALLSLYYRELEAIQQQREEFYDLVRGAMARRLQRLFRLIAKKARDRRELMEAEQRRQIEQAMLEQAPEGARALRKHKQEITAKYDALREADEYRRRRKQIDGVEKSKVLRLRRQRQWDAFKAEKLAHKERQKREAADAFTSLETQWQATIAERCKRKKLFLSQVLELEEPGEWKPLQKQLLAQVTAKEKALRAKYKEAKVVAPKQEVTDRARVEVLDEEVEKERREAEAEWLKAEAALLNDMDAKEEARTLQEKADERQRREKSAVRMQAAVRMFLARKLLKEEIRGRFVKEFDEDKQLAMYCDTYTQQRSARKPYALGSDDLEHDDRWVLIPDETVGQPYFFNPRRILQSWNRPDECQCCDECATKQCVVFASYWQAQDNVYLCDGCYAGRLEAEPETAELYFPYDGAVRGGYQAEVLDGG